MAQQWTGTWVQAHGAAASPLLQGLPALSPTVQSFERRPNQISSLARGTPAPAARPARRAGRGLGRGARRTAAAAPDTRPLRDLHWLRVRDARASALAVAERWRISALCAACSLLGQKVSDIQSVLRTFLSLLSTQSAV